MLDPDSTYFNTTSLTNPDLDTAQTASKRQDDKVYSLFILRPKMTPSQAHEMGKRRGYNWLITSVRRSFTTLTSAGLLVKLEDKRPGRHGRPETVWMRAAA